MARLRNESDANSADCGDLVDVGCRFKFAAREVQLL
jgi:hypothetical protein